MDVHNLNDAALEVLAKGLAYICFREGAEDIHAAGHISQEGMKELNKEVTNRMFTILRQLRDKPELGESSVQSYAVTSAKLFCSQWDSAEISESLQKGLDYSMEKCIEYIETGKVTL